MKCMESSKLEEIYEEVIIIRKKIEALEDLIIPKEEVSDKEAEEINALLEESLRGENVDWNELKRKLDI
ncbi:MAG: hypothetical protein WB392_07190 [Methanotrichaceae archaeon]